MKIGLDIDDTMTDTTELMIEYAKEYFKTDDIEFIKSILFAPKIEGELLEFYDKYLVEMMSKYKLKSNVKEVIDRFRQSGNKIIIITARGATIKNVIDVTMEYFKLHDIKVDDIVFRLRDKSKYCVENNIDLLVDDSNSVLEKVQQLGIKTLLFNSIKNKDIDTNINRVNNWLEVEQYINELLIKSE